jgi:hypothetical protein
MAIVTQKRPYTELVGIVFSQIGARDQAAPVNPPTSIPASTATLSSFFQ